MGNPACPCLTTAQRSLVTGWSDAMFLDANGTLATIKGTSYSYPTDYGTDACAPHDAAQQPYCSKAKPPQWCYALWCYINVTACTYPILSAHPRLSDAYYPGADLTYSYATCSSSDLNQSLYATSLYAKSKLSAHRPSPPCECQDTWENSYTENEPEEACSEVLAFKPDLITLVLSLSLSLNP